MTSVLATVSLSSSIAHHFWRHSFSSLRFYSVLCFLFFFFLSHGLPHMLDSHLLTHGCECHWNVMIEHVEKVLYMLFCFLLTRVCFFPVILILSLFFSLSFHDFFSKIKVYDTHTPSLSCSLLALQTG